MKKIIALILLCSLVIGMTGCSIQEKEASSEGKVEPTATVTPSKDKTISSTASKVAAQIAENTNLLTGEKTLTKEAYGKRSIAVMVNNATANLPQYGISGADLIFEIPVEGDTTRLMAMYGDYTQVPDICSVRSCRYYYPILSTGFDALYIHWGKDETVAKRVLEELDIDNIDGNYGSYNLFDRDQDKLNAGYALEHTSVLYGTKIADAVKDNDLRINIEKDNKAPAFNFLKEQTPAAGDKCEEFKVDFGAVSGYGYYSDFAFDTASKTYLKTHNGEPHMDGKSEKQLAFTNVIIMETPIGLLPNDNSGRREIEVTGKNKSGYYISGGKMQKITWSKADAQDTIKLFDKDGTPLSINTGKTYIAVCDSGCFVPKTEKNVSPTKE